MQLFSNILNLVTSNVMVADDKFYIVINIILIPLYRGI